MRTVSRWLVITAVLAGLVPAGAFAGALRLGPPRPAAARRGGARPLAGRGQLPGRAARGNRITVIDFDLQGSKAIPSAADYHQLRAVLMYLAPDIVALHTLQKSQAAGGRQAPLAQLAGALEMYATYQPITDTLGSALLSRHPITDAASLRAPSGVAVGLSATVSIGSRRYTVLAVRPPSATVDGDAIEAVSAAVKDQPGTASLVLASFNAKAGAADALKAWTKAGLADPRAGNAATYPAAKPAERADFVLVSAGMRSQVKSYRVIRDRRLAEVSAHLPVAVTLRR